MVAACVVKLQQRVFGLVGVEHDVTSVATHGENEGSVEVPLQRAFPFLQLRFSLLLLLLIQHRAVAAVTGANGDDDVVEVFVRFLGQRR